MTALIDIEQRKPIWKALSAFYLDTELDNADFRQIASTILHSPYSLDEVKTINQYEIFPVLQSNLLSPAGVWAGFDEDWLIDTIATRLNNKTKLNNLAVEVSYQAFKWMCKDYWERVEEAYNNLE